MNHMQMNFIFLFALHGLILNVIVDGEFHLDDHSRTIKQETAMSIGRHSIVERLFNAFKYRAAKNKNEQNMSNVFQPKFIETPTEEDYTQPDEYFDYEYGYDYDKSMPEESNQTSNGFIKTTTSSPRSTTKNQTLPPKFNLNPIFEFAQYLLRPTSQYENTIEVLNRYKMATATGTAIVNEEPTLNEQENSLSLDNELAETLADDK
jgi:hypothetical protein